MPLLPPLTMAERPERLISRKRSHDPRIGIALFLALSRSDGKGRGHRDAREAGEPGIQKHHTERFLDSGLAPSARPGMTWISALLEDLTASASICARSMGAIRRASLNPPFGPKRTGYAFRVF